MRVALPAFRRATPQGSRFAWEADTVPAELLPLGRAILAQPLHLPGLSGRRTRVREGPDYIVASRNLERCGGGDGQREGIQDLRRGVLFAVRADRRVHRHPGEEAQISERSSSVSAGSRWRNVANSSPAVSTGNSGRGGSRAWSRASSSVRSRLMRLRCVRARGLPGRPAVPFADLAPCGVDHGIDLTGRPALGYPADDRRF